MSEETGIDPVEEEAEGEQGEEGKAPRMGCLATLIPVTTPGCASLLTAVFLITTALTVWIVFWLDPNNIPWRHSYSLWRILGILLLGSLIPVAVYKTISLWLEGSPKAFPEVENAWRAGLNALAANELSIDSVPLFLITGSSSELQERSIMNATGMRFSVEGVPQGPAPIHWYANSEAIYVFCSDASWTSALASLREELSKDSEQYGLPTEIPIAEAIRTPAILPAPPSNLAAPSPTPENSIRGTLELNHFVGDSPRPTPPAPTPSGSNALSTSSPSSFRGTLILGDASATGTSSASYPPSSPTPVPQPTVMPSAPRRENRGGMPWDQTESDAKRKPVLVSHQYSVACLQELSYLGQLVRQSRQPVCPINGVLALIQIESIHSTPIELEELQKAIRGDMETIRRAFRLRVPVTALVVGLEKERGFRELVLRVGRERALSQRFGKRFDVQAVPYRDELIALAVHICGVFEDWAYALFREEQSLMRPGNTRLYELLSKVRCSWKNRLSEILAGGFGCESGKTSEANSLLMSGVYLAATGETPDRQAFVKGVIEKLNEEQELIEWTSEALRSYRKQNLMAKLGMFVTLGLAISLLLMYLLLRP